MNSQPEQKSNFWSNAVLIFMLLFIFIFIGSVLFFSSRIQDYLAKSSYANRINNKDGSSGTPQNDSKQRVAVTSDDPSLGSEDAVITIVEFSDFQCPYCLSASGIMKKVLKKYPDEVRLIYRDFPLSDIHPFAQMAAEGGECADDQGKFWEYHDTLFRNQSRINKENISLFAQQAGVQKDIFQKCIDSRTHQQEVQSDVLDGVNLGVEGTPTFFVNGMKIPGVIPYETWEQIIEDILSRIRQ